MDPFMDGAIEEAETGRREGGIPIGSVLVHDGRSTETSDPWR
jgi:cytosine/creatinine deaminase